MYKKKHLWSKQAVYSQATPRFNSQLWIKPVSGLGTRLMWLASGGEELSKNGDLLPYLATCSCLSIMNKRYWAHFFPLFCDCYPHCNIIVELRHFLELRDGMDSWGWWLCSRLYLFVPRLSKLQVTENWAGLGMKLALLYYQRMNGSAVPSLSQRTVIRRRKWSPHRQSMAVLDMTVWPDKK